MPMQCSVALDPAFSRRTAIRLGVGSVAAAAQDRSAQRATAADATPAATAGSGTTFVLVPGAWAWERVVPLLRAAGHDVYAISLTGLGDRAHLASPAITLDTHMTDVVTLLESEDLHDVMLVGWSYSGMVITGVAERTPERLAQVVYFDADVPSDGQNGWDAELYTDEAILGDVLSGKAADKPGFLTPDPYMEWIRSLATDPADGEWFLAKLVPQSLATYIQAIQLGNAAAAALPRAFIFCTEGKGAPDVDPNACTAERVRTDPAWTYRELADTHLAPVNDPQATADALLSLL